MATPSVLTLDAEGRAVDFEVWVDDLQLFLQCDRADGLSLFDLTSGASPAPPATADSIVRSQWATRDAAARLAVRRHLPTTERAHFSQYKSAQTLYDAVVARYSSPATAALSRLILQYLFPDLAAFPTVADLITHLRTSDTRYRAALPAEFCAQNPPPMYITLYYIVTRLPDSLRLVRDHFLSICPTTLTVDLLEERLLAAETSIVAVGASHGDPRTPIFEGRSGLRLPLAGGTAPARARGARALVGLAGAVGVVVVAVEGVGVVVGVVAGVEVSAAAVEAEEAVAVAEGAEVAEAAEEAEAAEATVELVAALRRGVALVAVSASSSNAVVRPRPPSSFSGGLHSTQRCFGHLTDAWRHQFPDTTEIPRWGDLFRAGVAIFDLDYDAILAAMYAVSTSDEGDCYLCLPPDPGSEAAALGACEAAALGTSASAAPGAGESALSGTASAQVFHTFTLDSGASRSFFRDRTTLTPLSRPIAVSLADPSGGPVLASFSTVLPCPAAPSGTLSGLYLPSFSTNLVSGAHLQDQGVDQFTPASQRVTHSSVIGRAAPWPPASSQVFAAASGSGPESAPCSCRLLSHQTLLWHHRLSHPSLPRLRGMASRVLVSGLPRSLPPLSPGPAPTCVPCVEGRQRAAPHSSEFPPTEAPLQTLHMDVWGPARVCGQGHERYFLLVVNDYSRYTKVFPLRSKVDVTKVLIDWIRAARLQLRESFAFCRAQGIRQTFTLPASPQQNGIAERRIGMVMDVARTSMIHAAAPNFLWPFAVGDASAFRVWGSRAFVRDLSADKLSPRAVPCVFLGFPPDVPGWQFYHPTSRRVLSSQDVTFDESVPYYRLFPYRTAPLPPPPLFLAPGAPQVDPLPPQGPAPSGVSQVDAVEQIEVAVDSGAARGTEPVGAGSGGTEPGGAEPGGAESGGAEPRGAEPGGAESGGAEPRGVDLGGADRAAGAGGPPVAPGPRGARTGGTGAVGTGGAAAAAGVGPARASGAAGAGAAGGVGAGVGPAGGTAGAAGGTGAAGPAGVGAVGAGGAGGTGAATSGTGAVPVGTTGPAWPRPYFVPLLEQPVSPLPAPSPYAGPTGGLAERREPASRPASPVRTTRTSRRAPRPRPPAVLGTHLMTLHPSTSPLRVPLPSPPESSLPVLADPASDSLRAASPTVARLLSTVVTDPSFESTAASALVAELVDFAARCRLDYAASLVAESASVCPSSVGGECALSTDVLEDRQEEFQCFAAALPHLATQRSSQGYTFSLGSGSVSWRSTRSSSVLGSSCEAVIYAGAMAARELRWLTYLLTDLGEPPRSPPVLYVDNKAMLALCREHRLEHRTKHIALRYFLARELQQRGQLRLAYVASEANTADIFTKVLAPGDHQRFCTMLGFLHVPTCFLVQPFLIRSQSRRFQLWLEDLQGMGDGEWCLFEGRNDCKLWRVLAWESCRVILHNMCETMGEARRVNMAWANFLRNRDPWWTRGAVSDFKWEPCVLCTQATLRERRKWLGEALEAWANLPYSASPQPTSSSAYGLAVPSPDCLRWNNPSSPDLVPFVAGWVSAFSGASLRGSGGRAVSCWR
ncbi:unnamed protein product [Closterium sp. NIES-54]